MSAVEWKVGDRGRLGDATFAVEGCSGGVLSVQWFDGKSMGNTFRADLLAAMGAVRLPPPVPPTIGTPQSVRDNPPPEGERVLVWWPDGGRWSSAWSDHVYSVEWWMPMPAPPPGVTQ